MISQVMVLQKPKVSTCHEFYVQVDEFFFLLKTIKTKCNKFSSVQVVLYNLL